jgi:hypothetical protein
MGEVRNAYRILVGKSARKKSLGRRDIDGRTVLKCILKK